MKDTVIMHSIKKKISFQEVVLVFAVCAFPIDTWTIINTFNHVPSWILSNDNWDFIGAIAYNLVFASIEIFTISSLLLLVGFITPKKLLKDNLVPLSFLFVMEAAFFAMAIIFNPKLFWQKRNLLILFIGIFGAISFSLYRYPKITVWLRKIIDRLAILAYLYLFLNVLSIVIIIIRYI